MLRSLLARAQAALQSLSREERHRRRVVRALALPLRELSPAEAADYDHLAEGIELWKSGELPIVVPVERPGIYTYPEPIGPRLPTVDQQFAAFYADPLAAPLPGAPAKSNPHFAEQLAVSDLPAGLVDDLELTGSYRRGYLATLASHRGAVDVAQPVVQDGER